MSDGTEYQEKRSFGSLVYVLAVIVIAVIGCIIILNTAFVITQTDVSGCEYSDEQEVLDAVSGDGYSDNSLMLFLQLKTGKQPDIDFVESVQVSFVTPWHICLNVTEKTLFGVMQNEDGTYSYFDNSGSVTEISDKNDTQLLQLDATASGDAAEGETLSLIPSGALEYLTEVFALNEQYDLTVSEVYIDTSCHIYLYTSKLTINLGSNTNTAEKFENLALILDQLEGKTGTIDLSGFSAAGDDIIFTEDE